MGWKFFNNAGKDKSETLDPINQAGLIINYYDPYQDIGIPPGWLPCYGQAVSRTTYSELFRVISTTYGSGNGSTTFNVPDLRGTTVTSNTAGSQDGGSGSGTISGGTTIAAQNIGTAGGATTVKLKAAEGAVLTHRHSLQSETAHRHSIVNPGHTHNVGATSINYASESGTAWFNSLGGSSGQVTSYYGFLVDATIEAAAPSGMQLNSTSADATWYHNNMQPWVSLLFIIKT